MARSMYDPSSGAMDAPHRLNARATARGQSEEEEERTMANLMSWSPRSELTPFSRDPFFRRLLNLADWDSEDAVRWLPQMSVFETKDEIIVEVDIPGIDPKSVEINLQDQTLSVQGERGRTERKGEVELLRAESVYGRFQRSLKLPVQVDPEKVKAKANLGVMTITMPKAKQYVGRQIPVEYS
jgi:HSP20 family protein